MSRSPAAALVSLAVVAAVGLGWLIVERSVPPGTVTSRASRTAAPVEVAAVERGQVVAELDHDEFEQEVALARAVIGGLLGSTIVTLVLIPVVYTLFYPDRHALRSPGITPVPSSPA